MLHECLAKYNHIFRGFVKSAKPPGFPTLQYVLNLHIYIWSQNRFECMYNYMYSLRVAEKSVDREKFLNVI